MSSSSSFKSYGSSVLESNEGQKDPGKSAEIAVKMQDRSLLKDQSLGAKSSTATAMEKDNHLIKKSLRRFNSSTAQRQEASAVVVVEEE